MSGVLQWQYWISLHCNTGQKCCNEIQYCHCNIPSFHDFFSKIKFQKSNSNAVAEHKNCLHLELHHSLLVQNSWCDFKCKLFLCSAKPHCTIVFAYRLRDLYNFITVTCCNHATSHYANSRMIFPSVVENSKIIACISALAVFKRPKKQISYIFSLLLVSRL